jgi:hypothetical protein
MWQAHEVKCMIHETSESAPHSELTRKHLPKCAVGEVALEETANKGGFDNGLCLALLLLGPAKASKIIGLRCTTTV